MPPRRAATLSDDDLLTDMCVGEIDTQVDQTVGGAGAPSGTTKVGDAQKVRLWGRMDKKVDPDLLRERLQTTGLGQEAPQMAICKNRPELIPLYMAPVTMPGLIDILVKLAQYPFRPDLFAHLAPKDAVAEANRIDRLWQAGLPPQMPEMPTAPTPPAAPQVDPQRSVTVPPDVPSGVSGQQEQQQMPAQSPAQPATMGG